MKRLILLVSLLVHIRVTGTAQEIHIGEQCPDVALSKLINAPAGVARLSDFRSPLLILEFWAHNCPSCIEGFSRLETLQQTLGDQVQIVLINNESTDSTLRFFKKHPKLKIPNLPMVTGDQVLSQLFPRAYSPWCVWIDSSRIVQHITEAYNTTEAHIRDFLDGKAPPILDIAYFKKRTGDGPLFADGGGRWLDKVGYYAYIMHCISGESVHNLELTDSTGAVFQLSRNCASIASLCAMAFGEGGTYNFDFRNRVILEVGDTAKYLFPQDPNKWDAWRSQYAYNYDLLWSPREKKEAYKIMQVDLERYFKVRARVERRKVTCLVLLQRGDTRKLHSRGGIPTMTLWTETEDSLRIIRNMGIERLVSKLQSQAIQLQLPTPVIDATGFKGNIDMALSRTALDNLDLPALRRELRNYGLDLVVQPWLTDVLVLKEQGIF